MKEHETAQNFAKTRNRAKQQFSYAGASLGLDDTVIKAMIDWQNELEKKTNAKIGEPCYARRERRLD